MKKIATAIAVTLLGASLAIAAPQGAPQNGGHWGHHRHGIFGKQLAKKLNVTDAQKAQIKDIKKASREQNKATFEQNKATFKEFFAAKKANDTAKMDQLKPAVEAARAQMKQMRAAEEAKIAQVLTPEQNAQWQQLKAEHAAKRAQREQK